MRLSIEGDCDLECLLKNVDSPLERSNIFCTVTSVSDRLGFWKLRCVNFPFDGFVFGFQLTEIYFGVLGDFLCGFSVSNRP